MNKINGKIILIDDENYEKKLLELALEKKNWEVEIEFISSGAKAYKYLKETNDDIFLIIADMKMEGMNGLDLKRLIDSDEKVAGKAIPFIFYSSFANQEEVDDVYQYRVQGYFRKPMTVSEQAIQLDIILKYWIMAIHPNIDYDKLPKLSSFS